MHRPTDRRLLPTSRERAPGTFATHIRDIPGWIAAGALAIRLPSSAAITSESSRPAARRDCGMRMCHWETSAHPRPSDWRRQKESCEG